MEKIIHYEPVCITKEGESMEFLDESKQVVGVGEGVSDLLVHCFNERRSIKAEMDLLESRKKACDEEVSTLMALSGVTQIKDESGTMSLASRTRASLDKAMLQGELLKRGLSASAVVEIITASTKETSHAFVEFRGKNGKGKGV